MQDFLVVPGERPTTELPDESAATTGTASRDSHFLLAGIFWAGFVVVLVAMLRTQASWYLFLPLEIFFAVSGTYRLVQGLRNRVAARKLGDVSVELDSWVARPGFPYTVRVTLEPRAALKINEVTVELRCREVAISGNPTRKKRHAQYLHKNAFKIMGTRTVQAGEKVEMKSSVPVPDDAAFSIKTTDNEIQWTLVVHVDIAKWPDWSTEYHVLVRPWQTEQTAANNG
jgi:hypothetical protein